MANDRDLNYASFIAYSNDLKEKYEELSKVKKGNITLGELCEACRSEEYPTSEDVMKKIIPNIRENDISLVKNWSMVATYDNNSATISGHTGYYGCMIDIGAGEAVIASRGSEEMTDLDNLVNDWYGGDLGLLNSEMTTQQADVDKFVSELEKAGYLDAYRNIDSAGHSLGGVLSMSTAVSLAEHGYADKLSKCVSFDGPGLSEEYISKHRDAIDKVSGKMTHYYWSLVGAQLNEIPGVTRKAASVKKKSGSFLDNLIYGIVGKHALDSIEFDDAGNVIEGQVGAWEEMCSKFSQGMDHLPAPIGNTVVAVIETVLFTTIWFGNMMITTEKTGHEEKTVLTPFGGAVLGTIAVAAIASGPVGTLLMANAMIHVAAQIAVFVAISFLAVIAFEYIYEFVEMVTTAVANFVEAAVDWIKERMNEFREAIVNGLNAIKNWLNETFNYGYRYANSNPQIIVDTYKLRDYAQRLQSINRRIVNLDDRLGRLYGKVGLLGLWNLIQARVLTGYSWRLDRCAHYLNETAGEFDSAEADIASKL